MIGDDDIVALGLAGAFDDLDVEPDDSVVHAVLEDFPAVAAAGMVLEQKRIEAEQRRHHQHTAIPVLNAGMMHQGMYQKALDIDENAPLFALDLLACIPRVRTLAVDEPTRLGMPAVPVAPPLLAAPTEGQEIVGDYETMGLTLRRHPLALLRDRLRMKNIRSAQEVAHSRNGQLIRTAGIVTCRQRPATASGVIFVTLEDETGYVNLIVWNDLADRQRRELLGSRLLAVHGEVQREGQVVHVLARRLADRSALRGRLATSSHDFH